jgi:hypothetical protein
MTAHSGYVWHLFDVYQESLSNSFANHPLALASASLVDFVAMIPGTRAHNVLSFVTHNWSGYIFPTYATDILNHWLIIPSTLLLGNLLGDQTRTVEIANLYSVTHQIDSITNNMGVGGLLPTLGSLPISVGASSSYSLEVQISSTGPPTLNGNITLTFDIGGSIVLPVTGQRVTLFPWDPEQFYTEELQWKTDIIEAYNGTEQRISVRRNPRQKLTYEVFFTDPVQDAQARIVLFAWLPRVWGVPIWWEQQAMTAEMPIGTSIIAVNTANADYRVGGLVFVQNPAKQYEAFEISALTGTQITVDSLAANDYPVGSKVMPCRTAYAKTQTTHSAYITGAEKVTVEFTTLDNINLADITGWTLYQGLPVLSDINYVENTLAEGMDRHGVTVIDNASGQIYQVASTDRSRPKTVKSWWTTYQADIWTIRKLVHWMQGSQQVVWLPTNRNDLIVAETYEGGSTNLTISNVGLYLYAVNGSGGMRPFGDIRVTLVSGATVLVQILGSTIGGSPNEEILSLSGSLSSSTLIPAQIARVEFLQLMRIADDKVVLTHDHPGRAHIVMTLIGVSA